MDFVTFGQSQASSFKPFPMFLLSQSIAKSALCFQSSHFILKYFISQNVPLNRKVNGQLIKS